MVINQAVRVDSEVRGQRLGKTLMQLGEDFLRELNPEIQQLKIIYTGVVSEKIINDPFMGSLVSDRPAFIIGDVEAQVNYLSILTNKARKQDC